MKVLDIGNIRYECQHCHSTLEIEKCDWKRVCNDTCKTLFKTNSNEEYVECPVCRAHITKESVIRSLESRPRFLSGENETSMILETQLRQAAGLDE